MAISAYLDPTMVRLNGNVLAPVVYFSLDGLDLNLQLGDPLYKNSIIAINYVDITINTHGSYFVEVSLLDTSFTLLDNIFASLMSTLGIRFYLRFGWTAELSEVLTGYISTVDPEFDGANGMRYVLKCDSMTVVANSEKIVSRTYNNKTASDIAEMIAIELGYTNLSMIEPTDGVIKSVTVPDGMGLMTFLKRIIAPECKSKSRDVGGYRVFESIQNPYLMDDKGSIFHFHAAGYRSMPGYDRVYNYNASGGNSDLLTFTPTSLRSVSVIGALGGGKQSAVSVDDVSKRIICASTKKDPDTGEITFNTLPTDVVIDRPDSMQPVPYKGKLSAEAFTKKLLNDNDETLGEGQITVLGDIYLEPYTAVLINVYSPVGLVSSVSGGYELKSVHHRIDSSNFITTAEILKLDSSRRKLYDGNVEQQKFTSNSRHNLTPL